MTYYGVYKAGIATALARVLSEYSDIEHRIHVDAKKTELLSCKSRNPIVAVPAGNFYVSPAVYCADCGAILDVRI